jgi:hypothetical protein
MRRLFPALIGLGKMVFLIISGRRQCRKEINQSKKNVFLLVTIFVQKGKSKSDTALKKYLI